MKLDFKHDGYSFITDDTCKLDSETLFLITSQNKRYYDALQDKPEVVFPTDLIDIWGLFSMKVVGVTGTNG